MLAQSVEASVIAIIKSENEDIVTSIPRILKPLAITND
jgi:hypothetical protein